MSGPIDANRDEAGRFEIRLKGHLGGRWASWFDGLHLSHEPDGVTVIHGAGLDQAALHGLLQKVRDTGLPLVSVTPVEPDQPSSLLPTCADVQRQDKEFSDGLIADERLTETA